MFRRDNAGLVADREDVVEARRALGRQLASLRTAAGISQHALAPLTLYGRSTVANVEVGRQNAPREFWVRADAALGAKGILLAGYDAIACQVQATDVEDASPPTLDSAFDIMQRVQAVSAATIDDLALDQLDGLIRNAIRDYERIGPRMLAPTVLRQRRWVQEILEQRNPPRLAARLYVAAARLSGLLAVIALDARRYEASRAYASEAFHLAQLVGEPDTQAWVRGAQSLIEYYAGNYQESLAFALDGLDQSPSGPQAIRLLVNGQARALARLGDAAGVRAAVAEAEDRLSDRPSRQGISYSLDLEPYCAARVAGNAATAYLHIGDTDRALRHAASAVDEFDRANLYGPQALTRLDMAAALLHGDSVDLHGVADYVSEALSATAAHDFASVTHRAIEFLGLMGARQTEPALRPAIEQIRELVQGPA